MEDSSAILLDETYEFSAPRFYDFINGETEEDVRNAELWFENTDSYAPSRMSSFFLTGSILTYWLHFEAS